MTVQVNYVRPVSRADHLVTVMVMPVPTPEGMSELAAVIDLLRNPTMLFGAPAPEASVDATCKGTSWEGLEGLLCVLDRQNVSVTYVRHLLHLAAHFARRHGLRRGGSARLIVFSHESATGIQYELPVQVSRAEALDWTSEFWGELAYVDLLQHGFLFSFVCDTAD